MLLTLFVVIKWEWDEKFINSTHNTSIQTDLTTCLNKEQALFVVESFMKEKKTVLYVCYMLEYHNG